MEKIEATDGRKTLTIIIGKTEAEKHEAAFIFETSSDGARRTYKCCKVTAKLKESAFLRARQEAEKYFQREKINGKELLEKIAHAYGNKEESPAIREYCELQKLR
jgi:hypothetical protein